MQIAFVEDAFIERIRRAVYQLGSSSWSRHMATTTREPISVQRQRLWPQWKTAPILNSLCCILLKLFRAGDTARSGGGFQHHKPSMQFGEKARRQEAVGHGTVVAIADAAKVGAGPVEHIAFGDDDP